MSGAAARADEVIRVDAVDWWNRSTCERAWIKRWPASWMCSVKRQPCHAYLFINKRANRMKVLVHDGLAFIVCEKALRGQLHPCWCET